MELNNLLFLVNHQFAIGEDRTAEDGFKVRMIKDRDICKGRLICAHPGLIEAIDKRLELLLFISLGVFGVVAILYITTPEVVEIRDEVR